MAVGVAIEIFVVLRDHKEEMEDWHFCKLLPSKPSLGKLGLEIASVVLVVVGILGEFGVGLWISHINGQLRGKSAELRSKSDQLVALISEQSAVNAREAAQLKLDAEGLKKQAEDERIARVRLQEDIAPRRLASDDRTKLSATVGQFAGMTAVIEYGSSDTEAYAFGADIALALSNAHWSPTDPYGIAEFRPGPFAYRQSDPRPSTGVEIEACPNDESCAAAEGLHSALLSLGFEATRPSTNCDWTKSLSLKLLPANPRGMRIFVRPRPEGPQGAAQLRHQAEALKHKNANKAISNK